ncbi:MAG: TonB-dependent receptor [Acidobacteriia bacterium]|nr:TonB-dependent receptor [Terriglobia bacterium]
MSVSLSALFGQTTSQLTGSITDKSGAVVADATVTVINVKTGNERKAQSGDSGAYTVPFLTPDDYRVVVSKTGFRQVNRDGIRLEVNQVARIDFSLEVGEVTQTIEVTGAPPLIESDSSSIGQVIETKAIQDLPLNGRNFVQLAILGPGVVGVGFGAAGTIMSGARPDDLRPGSELFSNGNREGSNNFLIDGVDNNERLTLAIVLRPSVEAVREFKIQTNMFAADQGRNAGTTVNVITKSGSNEWHGSAYEFIRNEKLDAKNFFARPGAAKPALRQNQFGGSFGGKIIPNKLFFFGNYEGFRRRFENTVVSSVPLPEVRTGDFRNVRDIFNPFTTRPQAGTATGFVRDPFPGRLIPATMFDSVMRRVINAYPMPQSAGLTNNYTSNPKDKQRWNQGDARIDWNATERDTVFGRYSRQDTVTTKPATFAPVTIEGMNVPVALGSEATFAGDSSLKTYNAVLSWIRTISPSFIMEAKMGYNRFNLVFLQEGAVPGSKLGELLGVKNANQGQLSDGLPIFLPGAYQGIGQTRSLPIFRVENTFHPGVNFTNIRGKHTVRFGLEARRRQVTQFQTNRGNGRFNFSRTFTNDPNNTANTGDDAAGMLLGTASTIEQDFTLVFPGMRITEWGTYVQDDWKVSGKLTLNLGLRYEYDTRITEVANRQSNFDVVTGKLLIAGFNTDPETGIHRDPNNFAPRFGFAYRLRPTTVLRGGVGIFYNPAGSESVLMRRHRQLPFGPINTVDINQFSANPQRVQDGLAPIPVLDFNVVANNPVGGMLAVDPNFKSGYSEQFNFQVQQQLPKNLVAKVGYVGNLGRRLDTSFEFNQPVPGPGAPGPRRPLIGIAPNVVGVTYNVSDGLSGYHSLQASLERRFTNGIGFLTAYTWAHSIDDVANAFGGADNGPIPQDRRCRRCDRGTSGFDIAQRFTHSMNYELPLGKGRKVSMDSAVANAIIGGWDMNVIFTAQTGLPFTPALATSVSNAGGSRPNRLKVGTIDNPTPNKWYDTSFNTAGAAWGVPAQFTFGDSGRNILRGPGRINFDYSVFKQFSFSEKYKLQFRTEIFNLFNTPQFALPNSSIGNPNAGVITSIVGNPRQIQLALRFSF